MKIEIGRFPDKRLKLLVHFTKSANFWEDLTWVPTTQEIEDLKEIFDAVDSYNNAKFLYSHLKPMKD